MLKRNMEIGIDSYYVIQKLSNEINERRVTNDPVCVMYMCLCLF